MALSRAGRAKLAYNANVAYIVGMATLNIRNLPEDVHRSLRLRAAHAGRSMEAEARAILAAACTDEDEGGTNPSDLQAFVDALYGPGKPQGVVDDLLGERKLESERE